MEEISQDDASQSKAGNWTVKRVSLKTRLRAIGAARTAGQPMGQWLGWAVELAASQQEQNGILPPAPAPVSSSRALVPIGAPVPTMEFFAPNITALVDAACKLAETRRLPKVLRETANRTLQEQLAAYGRGGETQ